MTIMEAIKKGMIELKNADIETPKLKARLLMQFTLNKPRQYIIVNDLNKLTANMAYDYMLSHENNKQIISYIEIACMQFNEIINFQIITQNIPIGEDVKRDIKHRLRLNAKAFLKANISFKYKLAYPILAYLWPR